METSRPASFMERGVAVPFTTPRLAGARIRPAERTGTEFLVPNPSGGRGVYVLNWGGIRQLCRPTVHDTLLHQRISRLPAMEPRGVRLAARRLAAEGMAGHEAAVAAQAAGAAEGREQVLTNFLLLLSLMEQMEPIGLRVSAETERTPELDRRARRLVGRCAEGIGRDAARVGADLEALSALFVSIGLDMEGPPPRLPHLAERLAVVADGLAEWAKRRPEDGFVPLAVSLARSAKLAASCATATLRAVRALTRDMSGLLRTWAATPAEIARQTTRPEWLLDGWERFCLLWETAPPLGGERAVLPEMAQLVPLLPREVAEWGEERMEMESLEPAFRGARLNDPWRAGGASYGLLARNERIQALLA